MLRSLPSIHPSRRLIAVLALGALAAALALAVTIEPRSSSSSSTAPSTSKDVADDGGESLGFGGAASSLDAPVAKSTGEGDGDMAGRQSTAAELAPTDALIDPAPGSGIVQPASPSNTLAAPELDARIIRTANVQLSTKRKRFESAWSDAQAVATSHGGYIVAASRSGASRSARTGSITMRVPTGRFEDAVESLRSITGVKVGALDVASQDVTQEYVDVKSRLRHDRAVERRLLTLLADADGVSEVLAVQARLDAVQEQIEIARGRLQYLDKLTAMSTIELSLTAPAVAGHVDKVEDKPGTMAQAFDDAQERFTTNVASAVVWFGGALPSLVVLALVALIGRRIWRRYDRQQDQAGAERAS